MVLPRLGFWSRISLALVLALALLLAMLYAGPSWSVIVAGMAGLVFDITDLLHVWRFVSPYTWAGVLVFLIVSVALFTTLLYAATGLAWLARRMVQVTKPYVSTFTFALYFILAGTVGAMTGLFAWTSSPYVGYRAIMWAYSLAGFVILGWSVAFVRCIVTKARR